MGPGVAGYAVWPGITRPSMAECGWATVAVGSHLGSQLGYFSAEARLAAGMVIERRTCPCCRGERPHPGRDIDRGAAARGSTTVPGCRCWHRASGGFVAAVPR